MTNEEAKLVLDSLSTWVGQERIITEEIVEAIKVLSIPSLPSNLDEAAEEYGRKEYSHAIHFWDEGLSKNKPEVMKKDFVDSFKAGAVWMAGQGVSFETEMSWLDSFGWQIGWPEDNSMFDQFNVGDKVIVQIRRK